MEKVKRIFLCLAISLCLASGALFLSSCGGNSNDTSKQTQEQQQDDNCYGDDLPAEKSK